MDKILKEIRSIVKEQRRQNHGKVLDVKPFCAFIGRIPNEDLAKETGLKLRTITRFCKSREVNLRKGMHINEADIIKIAKERRDKMANRQKIEVTLFEREVFMVLVGLIQEVLQGDDVRVSSHSAASLAKILAEKYENVKGHHVAYAIRMLLKTGIIQKVNGAVPEGKSKMRRPPSTYRINQELFDSSDFVTIERKSGFVPVEQEKQLAESAPPVVKKVGEVETSVAGDLLADAEAYIASKLQEMTLIEEGLEHFEEIAKELRARHSAIFEEVEPIRKKIEAARSSLSELKGILPAKK